MKWSASFILFASLSTFGEVSKDHVETVLQQMVRENVISELEAQKAKFRIRANVQSRSPASLTANNRIEEVNSPDLDGAKFKEIQKDMKKFVPEYWDRN
jgi:hypothetical protein